MTLVVKKFTFGPFSENSYVIWDEESFESMIVDPGCSTPEEENKVAEYIKERTLIVKYLVLTHGHIDHLLGVKFINEKYGCDFYAPELDKPLIENAHLQGEAFGIVVQTIPKIDKYITGDLVLKLGRSTAEFLFTPGHTPGEYCILFRNEEFVIAADVLFQGSIGRTDLWGGDHETLINSIKEKLLTLPDEFIVYSGHGENTKIGIERSDNPFLSGISL